MLFLSLTSNGQWYKLPPFFNPCGAHPCVFDDYPLLPYPAANGTILDGAIAGDPSSSFFILYESESDLDSSKVVFGNSGLGFGYFSATSKNDSTHCFIYNDMGSVQLIYTHNNFSSSSSTNPYPFWTPGYNSSCFSNNYIYTTWQNAANSGDSLIIERFLMPLLTMQKFRNFKYNHTTQLFFTTDSTGYMLCMHRNDSASVVTKTSDSGKTWKDSFLDSVNIITSFCFPTPAIGYLTENNGNIYKTTDAGNTWVQLTSPTTIALNCVSFSNAINGYVGGNGGILYKTITGGTSWTTETSGDTNSIYSLYTFDTVAYFIDANYNIYKNEKPSGVEKLQATGPFANIFPNPSNGKFSVELKMNSEKLKIEVYSMLGEKIESQSVIGNSQFVIDLSSQPNGIYLYRISSEAGDYTISGKLVIQK